MQNLTLQEVRPGDRVHLLLCGGVNMDGSRDWIRKSGRAVIINSMLDPAQTTVVVNIGGRYGTPAVVSPDNFIKASRSR